MKARADALVFITAIGAGWIIASAAGVFGPRAAVATDPTPEAIASNDAILSTGRQLLAAAESASDSGDYAGADRIQRTARTAIDQELRRAKEVLRGEAAELAVDLAAGMLRDRVTDEDRARLVDEFIARVEQAPAAPGSGR